MEAIETRFFWPKLSAETGQCLIGYRPQIRRVSFTLRSISSAGTPRTWSPSPTSSAIIGLLIICSGDCITRPILSPRSRTDSGEMSSPFRRILPLCG